MKRTLIGALLLLLLGAGSVLAANPETFNVLITIRQAIAITKVDDLDFGRVEAGAATYTVTAAAGAQPGAGTGAIAASFDVTGESGQTATVALGANPVTINCTTPLTCGAETLAVNLTQSTAAHTFTAGTDQIYVGGSVDVTGASAGQFTGSTTISLVYQ
jgi:hypothetical protein